MEQTTFKPVMQPAGFNWGDFFSFRKMITPQFIQVIYIIGAALITFGGIGMMFNGQRDSGYGSNPFSGFGVGLIVIAAGNLFWRIWCEFIIVIFRVNQSLKSIDEKTKE